MDWFIRRENIKHFRKLLDQTSDKNERERIKRLLADEEMKGLERVIEPPSSSLSDGARRAKQQPRT